MTATRTAMCRRFYGHLVGLRGFILWTMTIRRKVEGKGEGGCDGNNEDKKEGTDEEAEEEVSDGMEWCTRLLFFSFKTCGEMIMASS